MRSVLPEAFEQFLDTIRRLEEHYRDMQDIEFTVEEGTLYLLQTRTGEADRGRRAEGRGGHGRRGADLARGGGRADRARASSSSCSTRCSTRTADYEVAATGLNASPGAASGKVVFDAATAERRGARARA